MCGYGGSSVYDRHEDYAQEWVVADMLGLVDLAIYAEALERNGWREGQPLVVEVHP